MQQLSNQLFAKILSVVVMMFFIASAFVPSIDKGTLGYLLAIVNLWVDPPKVKKTHEEGEGSDN